MVDIFNPGYIGVQSRYGDETLGIRVKMVGYIQQCSKKRGCVRWLLFYSGFVGFVLAWLLEGMELAI